MSHLTCPNCKEKIKSDERNCHICGQLISKVDTSYHTEEINIEKEIEEKKKVHLENFKICIHCHTSNKINAVICRHCNKILRDAIISKYDERLIEQLSEADSKKQKRNKTYMIIYLAAVFCIALAVLISHFSGATILLFIIEIIYIVLAIGLYFNPDLMFSLNLYNIWVKDPEPTEFYYSHCKVSAVILPLLAFLMLITVN